MHAVMQDAFPVGHPGYYTLYGFESWGLYTQTWSAECEMIGSLLNERNEWAAECIVIGELLQDASTDNAISSFKQRLENFIRDNVNPFNIPECEQAAHAFRQAGVSLVARTNELYAASRRSIG